MRLKSVMALTIIAMGSVTIRIQPFKINRRGIWMPTVMDMEIIVTNLFCLVPTQHIAQSGDRNVGCRHFQWCRRGDGVDNNDGQTDEGVLITYYIDSDGDGYGTLVQLKRLLGTGYVDNSGDCNDSVPEAYTNASETCDGLDNTCDGQGTRVLNTWYLIWTEMDMATAIVFGELYISFLCVCSRWW